MNPRFRTPLLLLLISIFLILTPGCGSDGTPSPPVLSSLIVSASDGTRLDLFEGETTNLEVEGRDQNRDEYTITTTINYSTNNTNVSVDENGVVTPLAVGTSIITVTVEDIDETITITVWDSSAPRTEIYVSDVGVNRNGPHRIIRYDETGAIGEVFISASLARPQDIVFLEDKGEVLVSNLGGNNINRYNSETGAFISTFASGLAGPTRIDIGPDNLLYAIQWNGGPVKRYDLDGNPVDDFTSTSINQAIGMAWDSDGNLYVSSFNNGSNGFVLKFDTEGNDMGTFASGILSGPTDIWFDQDGNLLVNDWSANAVRKFDASGTFLQNLIANVSQPEGVAFLDNGNILIGASGSSSVKMYDANGSFLQDLVVSGGGGLVTPNAVVIRKVNQ